MQKMHTYTEPDAPPALERVERIREHIENIDSHLLKTLGMAKTPLAYVVRSEEVVPPQAHDPPTNYGTIQEEMVARMPHMHPAYQEDNIKVWEIIRDSLHETEAYNWIKASLSLLWFLRRNLPIWYKKECDMYRFAIMHVISGFPLFS
jgi:hypothetical protein